MCQSLLQMELTRINAVNLNLCDKVHNLKFFTSREYLGKLQFERHLTYNISLAS